MVAGTVAIVLMMNNNKYSDPMTPFNFKDIQEGQESTINSIYPYGSFNDISDEHKQAAFDYVTHIGKQMLVEKKFPLLQFDGPGGGFSQFHHSIDALLLNRYPDVKRHKCESPYDYPGQASRDWFSGITVYDRIKMKQEKQAEKEGADKVPASPSLGRP